MNGPGRGAILAGVAALLGAAPGGYRQLDSQYVLQRYAAAIETAPEPKNVVFTYSVSQAGPVNIEQRHMLYRSGSDVRDETLAVDGVALRRKIVRFSRRADRYAVARLAPRVAGSQILFLRAVADDRHLDYTYDVSPLLGPADASVDRMSIDGLRFLPRMVHFHTAGSGARGTGEVEYAAFGRYWMPILATIDASVNGKPARERITWSDYRFPESLPSSTFQSPKRLPTATLPPM